MPVGETRVINAELYGYCQQASWLCQTGSDSEGLALLAIATVTANCEQASLSCGDQHTDT